MSNVQTLLALPNRAGDVGIELEVEFIPGFVGHPLPPVNSVWLIKGDDSLRNGREYYVRQPIMIDNKTKGRIVELTNIFDPAFIVPDSIRTGLHVHANVLAYRPKQIITAMVAWWLLEGPLMEFCGADRKGNYFCLKAVNAEYIIDQTIRAVSSDKLFSHFDQEKVKYSCLNPATISRQGSLEVRGMRGTTDPELIYYWCRTVHEIISGSRFFEDPDKLLDFYFNNNNELLYSLLLPSFEIEKIENHRSMIKESARGLCDLAYYYDDWNKWENRVVEYYSTRNKKGADLTNILQTTIPANFGLDPLQWEEDAT